ncbi:MAG TPA: glycoside hydrolase 43 family protein [Bryobacteraceae bacterium]|nr:glycoside hydrolase 43 family protein [Bryobacteraceae bacterium]
MAFSFMVLAIAGLLLCASAAAQQWGTWSTWGDQKNGTYRNPVIPADYSDIDCIRVGDDYYAISSTMQFSPGMVVLHSKDLVNWSILGHVITDLTQIGPELNWDKMNRYGRGVWAGAIRYHAKRFWVYFGAPDEGYFMTSASNPSGPWEPLHRMLAGEGWNDPCPFWDDDGQGYIAGTNFRDGYKIHLWKLSPDSRDLVLDSDRVIHQSKGSEATKLYKFNGLYYHLFSEVKPEGRVVMMKRASNIYGPYTEPRQLNYADRPAMEPNQGGLVQTPAGDWYWFTHHGTGDWEGRAASLMPVRWIDGWPDIGHFVWSGNIPAGSRRRTAITMQTSDEFANRTLGPQWEWNYQPRADKWSLTERPGWLRLHAFKPIAAGDLKKAGNTLTQRSFRTAQSDVVVQLDLSGMTDGQHAGLCHLSKDYSSIRVSQSQGTRTLQYEHAGNITNGPELKTSSIWLKSAWGLDGKSRYSYSLDGKTYSDFGGLYQLSWGHYRGDRIGLFTFNDFREAGFIDVNYLRYGMTRQ